MTLRFSNLLAFSALLTLPSCGDNLTSGSDGLDIRGQVWHDDNANGLFDEGETPIAGSRIFLDDNDNRIAEASELQTLSDAAGRFHFAALPAGAYTVRQDLDFGWRPSSGSTTAKQSTNSTAQLSSSRHHIIGGSDADDMAYPFMVSLGTSSSTFFPFCGGVLVSDRFVLTAAHCSGRAEPSDVSVMVGTRNPSAQEGVRALVSAFILHPEYNDNTDDGHDMALWQLAERLDLSALGLHTIEMLTPANEALARPGALATTIGWGVSDRDSELLQEVHLPIVGEDACSASYPQVRDFETQICAGAARGGIDSCQGDSGGPLLVRDKATQRWLHAGVTSWGDGCALPGKPGIYARTSAMSAWASEFLREDSTTYLVQLKSRDVNLAFPNQATTRALTGELDPRWSMSSLELAGVTDGLIAAGASFQARFFLFSDPDYPDQDFGCSLDLDGPGILEADSFSCAKGTNSIGVAGYPDGIYLPELRITSANHSITRSQLIRAGEPPSTELEGALSISDSTDADYPGSTYFIDYFDVSDAEVGKAIVVELESSFGAQLALYDADQRSQSGGGILRIDAGGQSNSVFFVPEADRRYLIGVSSTSMQVTGSYTLRMVNSGTATATSL